MNATQSCPDFLIRLPRSEIRGSLFNVNWAAYHCCVLILSMFNPLVNPTRVLSRQVADHFLSPKASTHSTHSRMPSEDLLSAAFPERSLNASVANSTTAYHWPSDPVTADMSDV